MNNFQAGVICTSQNGLILYKHAANLVEELYQNNSYSYTIGLCQSPGSQVHNIKFGTQNLCYISHRDEFECLKLPQVKQLQTSSLSDETLGF